MKIVKSRFKPTMKRIPKIMKQVHVYENSEKFMKMMGGQKMFGSVMKVSHKPESQVEKNMKKQESSKKPRITGGATENWYLKKMKFYK